MKAVAALAASTELPVPPSSPGLRASAAYRRLLGVIFAERSGFYALMAVLAQHLRYSGHPDPAGAVGQLSASVYGFAFAGGLVGDRVSYRVAALAGGVASTAAYALLWAGAPFLAWVALLALGIGLFKPAIPVMVGKSTDDPQEQAARMTRFYSWVNVGGLVGPLLVGLAYHPGHPSPAFALVTALSAASVLAQLWSWRALGEVDFRNPVERAAGVRLDLPIKDHTADDDPLEPWRRIRKILVLCCLSVVFWAGYHAFFGPVALWFDASVDRCVGGTRVDVGRGEFQCLGGWEFPVAFFQDVNPALLILVGFLAPAMFARRTLAWRVAAALAATCVGFRLLAHLSAAYGDQVPLAGAVAAVVVVSVGELLISPLGLATVASLAPRRFTALLMALWYAGSAAGGWLSALLGNAPGSREFTGMALAAAVAVGVVGVTRRWLR